MTFGCERRCNDKPNSIKTGFTSITPIIYQTLPFSRHFIPDSSCFAGCSFPRCRRLPAPSAWPGVRFRYLTGCGVGLRVGLASRAPRSSPHVFGCIWGGVCRSSHSPLPSRPWFALGLPLLGAFPAAGFVSVRAVLAPRSGWRAVCAGVSFRPCNRRNHPTPICPYLPVF